MVRDLRLAGPRLSDLHESAYRCYTWSAAAPEGEDQGTPGRTIPETSDSMTTGGSCGKMSMPEICDGMDAIVSELSLKPIAVASSVH